MYIGNTPTTQAFTPAIDYFSGNGSTVAFTLSRQVASVAQVQAVIENVPQSPGTAFTVSGNVITFTSAPPSGTNNIYVYYTSPITQVIAPGQGTVGTAALAPNIALSGQSLTVAGNNISAVNSLGFRNRIINGDMRIDQRNAGAAISLTNSVGYPVDRFIAVTATSTTVSFQQSAIAPANFTKSLSATVTTPKTLAAADLNRLIHRIEGFNIADLNWGTASAQPVTLSFWARASVTGTYTVQIGSGQNYLAAYTINTANTWEQKTIIVPGATSGTWPTDNSAGLEINFVLGAGSNWVGVAGAWGGSAIFTVSGAANWIGTSGATFYITGVQLEAGVKATNFDYRPYGTELALCQRYFFRTSNTNLSSSWGAYYTATAGRVWSRFPVTMRAAPTITTSSLAFDRVGAGAITASSVANFFTDLEGTSFDGIGLASDSMGRPLAYTGLISASAEL